MKKSFLESADSWKAKAHLTSIKTPMLVGISALMLLVLYLIVQNIWFGMNSNTFEMEKQTDTSLVKAEKSDEVDVVDEEEAGTIVVHVAGAVTAPGVFELDEGERLSAAIEAAGGLREDAIQEGINLARLLVDGEQIIVPTAETYNAPLPSGGPNQASGKVNINTANIAELMTLPGVGEVTAEKIIKQRESIGSFSVKEDIKQVSGIGDKKFEQIADLICV